MRRVRKIRHWKFKKLLKAKVLKINYTLSRRTLRKAKNKNRLTSQGLLKIGGVTIVNFLKFLKPTLNFSYYSVTSVAASILPSLNLPKSTDSTPKYFLSSPLVTPLTSYKAKKLLPLNSSFYTPGLHLLLLFNTVKELPARGSLDYKAIIYASNYYLTGSMLKASEPLILSNVYRSTCTSQILKKKKLLSLYFYN